MYFPECLRRCAGTFLFLCLLAAWPARAEIKVGYSDWPGWVAWQVAIDKDWFKEAGVEVQFDWFDYVASMDAFATSAAAKMRAGAVLARPTSAAECDALRAMNSAASPSLACRFRAPARATSDTGDASSGCGARWTRWRRGRSHGERHGLRHGSADDTGHGASRNRAWTFWNRSRAASASNVSTSRPESMIVN